MASTTPRRRCWAGCGFSSDDRGSVLEQLLELGAECRRDVLTRQPVSHVCGKEPRLRAAVETAARKLQAVKGLLLHQADQGVGELDLIAGAALLRLQDLEDFRLQDVAAGDDEVRRRLLARRLLDHAGDLERLAGRLA